VIKESMSEAKFDALDDYKTSPLFSEAELPGWTTPPS